METPNTDSLSKEWRRLGVEPDAVRRAYHTFNAWAEPFRGEGESHDA
jgi:hypothetical protein